MAHVVQETLDEIVRHRSLKVPEPHLNLPGAADGFSLRYPTPAEYAAQPRQPHRSVDCEGPTIEDLPGLREDMRNPGLPKVAIFGVTARDQLPSAEQLRSHRAPSFEADTFAFALFENDLDLNRILKLLDPQCIVTIGDMPSFTNPLAAPYYICREWIHMDRAADLRGIDIQSYAAAVYLTPDAPPQSGTSFWRDRVHGCRRRPDHPLER